MKEADRLRRENETLRARLARLSEVSLRVTASLDLDTVLQEVVDGARSLTGARYGAVGVLDDSGRVQDFTTSGIAPDERRPLEDPPEGQGILGYLNEIREPLRLADLTRQPMPVGFPEHDPLMRTFLGAPIRHLGEPVANICLIEKEGGREFTEEDEAALAMLASQAAVAIANAIEHGNEKRARGEAETTKQHLEALVATSPVGVLVVDARTRTLEFVNREAERIMGIPAVPGSSMEQFYSVTIYRRTDGREYPVEERPLLRALMYGEVVRAEEVLIDRPGGGTTMVLVNATPIYSEDGEITSAVAMIQGMTPLEEVERLRNEFLAMVSHELRTPLTTIKGCTSVVLSGSSPPSISEMLQYFRMIDEQSDHLRDLVNNLRDMTQIEAGALSVTPKPTDVTTLVDEAKDAFARRGARNPIEVDLAPDLPLIAADRQRIAQVLNNLLSNASKYSSETSTIRITGSRDALYAAVSITDEGRGISADQLTSLFKKFSRIDGDSRERKVAGEGLGLAICKGIVEAHGGRIWAESGGEGRGARITFTIPEAADVQESTSGAPAVRPSDGRRILAVDDEPQVLWLLRNILSEHGYEPLGTGNPDEMMHLLETEQPRLVLLDLMMPRASGFELMGRIRKVSDAPIIFLSANDQEENIAKALDMGADDYIVKPFSSTELVARVAASLRKRGSAGTSQPRQPYSLGDLTIDYADRGVTVSGRPVQLTATEYKLLFELSTNAGRVLTHDQLLQRVWGSEYSGAAELVRAFVKKLRHKLGDDANDPRYIYTEPRVGYRMAKP